MRVIIFVKCVPIRDSHFILYYSFTSRRNVKLANVKYVQINSLGINQRLLIILLRFENTEHPISLVIKLGDRYTR